MARKIVEVQSITVESGSAEITNPFNGEAIGNYKDGSEWFPGDKIVYLFQKFSGSMVLTQKSGSMSGAMIYDAVLPAQSGPWDVKGPPRWLFNSGSNSQTIEVCKILVR